jgi:hypothetical protein
MRIRLTRKLALTMNGIDVSRLQVGDIIELRPDQAEMMVVCGWAERVDGLTPGAFPQTMQRNLGRECSGSG